MYKKNTRCIVQPVYLPDKCVYTEKFIQETHEATLHGRVQLTMAKVREQHWVPRLTRLVKRIGKKCPGCKRFWATALAIPPPGLLPKERTEGSFPFQVVGVDYAGRIKYKATNKSEGKAYIILYACSLTRVLYLDLVKSIQTTKFLLRLKGMMARRAGQVPSTLTTELRSLEQQHGSNKWKPDEKLN